MASSKPLRLNLVPGPKVKPCAAEPFSFWRALATASLILGAAALVGHFWIVPAFLAPEPPPFASLVHLRTAETLEEEKVEAESPIDRVVPPRPVAPTVPVVPIPALQPVAVAPVEWDSPVEEPYDPTELLEESEVPFEPAEEEPQVVKTTPKKSPPKPSKPESTRRPSSEPASPPKPVAQGPSRPAGVVRRFEPSYPKAARRAGTEGRVVLTVQVRPDGRVGSVRVASSSGSATLDSAAISAVKRWKFRPELQNGRPVSALLNVPFRFSLE